MMKQILSILALFLVMACNHESKDERISRQAREFTKTSCPKPMDEYTVLDSLVYVPDGKVMTYYYSVSDRMDTDSVYDSKMLDVFHTSLLSNIRQNTGLLELKEHSVTFKYVYSSSTNDKIYMSYIFAPCDYK